MSIKVELENGDLVDVKKHTWDIYQYYFDQAINALASKTIGYFTQYPLKLAWAVTIHKSQGQTFERVVIDVGGGTFSHGQMYVALSRCTTLEGIVLKQPLLPRHILMDERVLQFMKTRAFSFIFFILFLAFSTVSRAQTPDLDRSHAVEQALSSVEEKQVNPKSWEENNTDQPYIGLLTETDTTIHDDWSFDEDYHARVKIQKEAAKRLGQWPIYYNKSREEITDIQAFVETPDGKKLEATDIKDIQAYDQSPLYADMRLKVISFPKISLGSVIDVRVKTKVLREGMPNQFWDQVTYPSIPTKYVRYTFVFPENKPIVFHAYNDTMQPIVEKKDGTVKYSFVFENTAYSENEDFMPPAEETIGVLSLSSLSDWKQVADWWRELINKNTVDDPDITAKVQELVSTKLTPKDKARAILEFIQDNFRYVAMHMGDHTVEFHPTNSIFHNHYGDRKDLSLLARQMFKIAGIDADICLFSGEFNGNPQHSLPNPSAFDHMILQISLGDQKYFVDTQTKGFDLGQLPSGYDNAYVLIIAPQSYRFDNIPVAEDSFHSVISSSDITIAEDGSADFQVHVQMPVEASQDFKSGWDSTSDNNKQKFFDNLQATFAQGGKVTDRNVKGLENRYGPLEFDFKYSSPNAYSLANDMILVREAQQGDVPDFAEDKRHYPIFVPTNSLIKNSNTYHIANGLKVDFVPADYDLQTNFMQVTTKYTQGDNTVTVESIYRLKRAVLPAQAYAEVKKFRDELDKKSQQYIVLKKKSNLAPETKTWVRTQ